MACIPNSATSIFSLAVDRVSENYYTPDVNGLVTGGIMPKDEGSTDLFVQSASWENEDSSTSLHTIL